MLKKRVIPTLLMLEGRLVKGKEFKDFRDTGNPRTTMRGFSAQHSDEIMLINLSKTEDAFSNLLEVVKDTAAECFMPLTVGGGVRSIDDVKHLLRAGADKVAVNTQAINRPDFIAKASSQFGSQCIVVSADVRRHDNGEFEVFTLSGTQPTGLDPVNVARKAEQAGAGEILITSIERDGAMMGYDIELIGSVTESVSIPVIASGGVGTLDHLHDGIVKGGASAVLAASIFHYGEYKIKEAKEYLNSKNVSVRL